MRDIGEYKMKIIITTLFTALVTIELCNLYIYAQQVGYNLCYNY